MNTSLTKRQSKVLSFIRKHVETKHYPPSVRDIATEFGIASPNGVHCHLVALEKKGHIKRVAGIARGILLVNQ